MARPKKIDRIRVVQDIINRKKSTNYLGIGVLAGDAFLRIKSRRKWAVDPDFMISPAKKFRYYFKNPYNILNKYFRMESNIFFDTHADAVQNLSYRDLSEKRESLSNLKDASFIEEFLKNSR
jgi:hypothetical protein